MSKRFYNLILLGVFFTLTPGCSLLTSSNHNTTQYTPVFADASAGNLQAVKAAVDADPSVLKATEWDGATLLHIAVGQNQTDMAAFLLDRGADVNAITQDRLTPLHMASQNGNISIIQLLLDHKAKINPVDSKGWTPLDRANMWRHTEAAAFLRQHGAIESSSRTSRVSKQMLCLFLSVQIRIETQEKTLHLNSRGLKTTTPHKIAALVLELRRTRSNNV